MTIGFVAFHYPRPEHFEEFIGRTHKVRDTLQASPGCLSVDVWATADGDAVVTSGQFGSEEALQQALAAARGLGAVIAFDKREQKPRQIFTLISR
jgi:quinol monooxygenase YgiN